MDIGKTSLVQMTLKPKVNIKSLNQNHTAYHFDTMFS